MADLSNHPHIEMVKRTALRPNPRNPRKHSRKQLKLIAESIQKFGFLVPLIVDDDNLIVAGAGRWEASAPLRMDELPVIRVKFLTEADRRAFALAENRLSDLSGFDDDIVQEELAWLFEQEYDLSVTGFDLSHVDSALATRAEANRRSKRRRPMRSRCHALVTFGTSDRTAYTVAARATL